MKRLMLTLAWLLLFPLWAAADSTTQPSLFNPDRHMRVSEVQPGMKGYGLTVFKGSKVERFSVEALSVLHNFNPQYDVVLIKCGGANLEHTGAISGMSGSPIFLIDAKGRERMIGAFAYGWPFTKDAVGGVQPIEYMLDAPLSTKPAGDAIGGAKASAHPRGRWSLSDVPAFLPKARQRTNLAVSAQTSRYRFFAGEQPAQLQALATPLLTTGVSQKVLAQMSPAFEAYGLLPLQAGGAGGSGAKDEPAAKLEPGSVMAVPLLTGDVDMTALGTCTEVIGNRIFGFGHPFNNEGSIDLPVGGGQVHGVIANLSTSFKLGSMGRPLGRLTSDRTVGVAGLLGEPGPMVPIELRVSYTDGSQDRLYRFNSALHPKFTPLILLMAFSAALGGSNDLPQYNTLDYDLSLEFANGQTIKIANTTVNAPSAELFAEFGAPLMAAAENPFERVLIKKMSGTVRVSPEAREAQILEVNVPRAKYHAGETVRAFVTYKPFHGAEAILPAELELPKDLPVGSYQLVISDWQRYMTDEQQSKAFRFNAETLREMFDVLRDVSSMRHNALYLRLVRQPDGVAIGRTAMPQLPSSRRQVIVGAGRSNTTRFVSSTSKSVPTEMVMNGSAEFTLTIEADTKVQLGKPAVAQPELPQPPAKPEEPKARPGANEKPAPKDTPNPNTPND